MANDLDNWDAARRQVVRDTLRTEFTNFFVKMTTATGPRWPNIGEQELADALADSLVLMGKQRGLGVAILQTLVYELQERVDQNLANS